MCGIAGTWKVDDSYFVLHDLLLALQHRGQESTGIVIDGFKSVKGYGTVNTVLTKDKWAKADCGIGHVRYSTIRTSREIQPIVAYTKRGRIAIAHNGTIPNAKEWFESLLKKGAVFQSELDTEIFLHLFSMAQGNDMKQSIIQGLFHVDAAYSLVIMHEKFLALARDPHGFRPLFYGKYKNGYVAASEDSALLTIGVRNIKEVPPGTIVFINEEEIKEIKFKEKKGTFCSFEYIYFARPDSSFMGIRAHQARFRMGEELYKENPIKADVVIPVLDSGVSGALGFSKVSNIPLDFGLMKNRYVGRSFIMPTNREEIVRKKLIPIEEVIKGKKIVLIDDSIVRGTTMGIIVNLLRKAGAKEIHVGIHSPPVKFPCFYGIDTPKKEELTASSFDINEIRKKINVDNLFYLSLEGLKKAIGRNDICLACFNGEYPHQE